MNDSNYQTICNHYRAQAYYQKLLAYYGGVLPPDYIYRVNRGRNGLARLREYWQQREQIGRNSPSFSMPSAP